VLPAGVSNEGQFAFSVQSIVQPSKMKGTLTYMVKVRTSANISHKTLKYNKYTCSTVNFDSNICISDVEKCLIQT
jgi:AP-3 complex subunit delta-1